MIYIISGPPSRIRTSDPWKYENLLQSIALPAELSVVRVPVRLELTTLHLLGVRSKPTELWDLLLEEIDKKMAPPQGIEP